MRRPTTLLLTVVGVAALTVGCGDFIDTRSCKFVDATQVNRPCDVDDVRGTVVGKLEGSRARTSDGVKLGNPSVRVDTRDGEVRVFMKKRFWDGYRVGDAYP